MKRNNNLSFITFFTFFFLMGILNLWGQKQDFASRLKTDLTTMEKEADKDPDTFKDHIEQLEKKWGNREKPVERSVVHALLGSAYREMKWTSISDYDEETRDAYTNKMKDHFAHVLDDMDALADAKSDAFSPFVTKGKDRELYANDMLSVMIAFVMQNANKEGWEKAEMYQQAFDELSRI